MQALWPALSGSIGSGNTLMSMRHPVALQMPDGLTLCGTVWGPVRAPAALLLHGFGQTRHAWDETASTLADAGFHVLAIDARGHGESEHAADGNYLLDHFVADVREVLATLPGRPVIVGASLGGLAALLVEGQSVDRLTSALVLVDITPRFEVAGVERILAFMRAAPDGFPSLESAGQAIAKFLPHRQRRTDTGGLVRYLDQDSDGRWRWHWDPRMLSKESRASAECHERFLAAAQNIRVPVMLVSGEHSDVVSEETIAEFMTAVPHARHVVVDDAHHMVAGDSNKDFNEVIVEFLKTGTGTVSHHAEAG